MRLHIYLRVPDYRGAPRWLKVTVEHTNGSTLVVRGKLRWWWRIALYWRVLRMARIRVER